MTTLILETSTSRGILALFDQKASLYEKEICFGIRGSDELMPIIQSMFSLLNLKPKDLSLIVVGIGPGSYTGIRVGASIAQTLSFALQVPIIALSSLEAFIPNREGSFASIIDAKTGGAYILIRKKSHGQITGTDTPKIVPLENLQTTLDTVSTIVGPNIQAMKTKTLYVFPNVRWHWEEQAPNASYLAKLAYEKQANGLSIFNQTLDLLYLRSIYQK